MRAPAAGGSMPLISIITPYRDARRFLPGLVATLQAQTYRHWECLLVDHASSDGGGGVAAALTAGDGRFRHLRVGPEAGGGARRPAIPRNAALEQVRGTLLCFLDVDDLWHPKKLERQLAFHQQHHLDISVTAYGRTQAHRPGWCTWRCPPSALDLRRLRRRNAVPMLTVMVAATLFQAPLRGGSPLRFSPVPHEDYVLWLQLWRQHPALRYGCLPDLLALHQRHGGNTTSQRTAMVCWLFAVHHFQAPAPVAAWRALVGGCDQLALTLQEELGARRVPCDPSMLMGREPLSILSL
jgi:teichuronic acid biosynthesis glycosyltransferase TuaG